MAKDTNNIPNPFWSVFTQHEAALRAYARAILPTWDAVDETMQEASLVMCRKISELPSEGDFLPWAKVVLRFEALKTRRRYASDRHVFSSSLIEILAEEGLEQQPPHLARQEVLKDCLDDLSDQYRELVMAPYQTHGAVTAIAEQSGRSPNSLYKLLGRIRRKLRQCVDDRLAKSAVQGEVL